MGTPRSPCPPTRHRQPCFPVSRPGVSARHPAGSQTSIGQGTALAPVRWARPRGRIPRADRIAVRTRPRGLPRLSPADSQVTARACAAAGSTATANRACRPRGFHLPEQHLISLRHPSRPIHRPRHRLSSPTLNNYPRSSATLIGWASKILAAVEVDIASVCSICLVNSSNGFPTRLL